MAAADITVIDGFSWTNTLADLERYYSAVTVPSLQLGAGPHGENCIRATQQAHYIQGGLSSLPTKIAVGFHARIAAMGLNDRMWFSCGSDANNFNFQVGYENGIIQLRRDQNQIVANTGVSLPVGRWFHIEVVTELSNSAAYEVFLNGNSVASGTGDFEQTAPNSFFRFGATDDSSGGNTSDLTNLVIQEGAGSSQLGPRRVSVLRPAGNGANSGLTGSDADSTDNYLHVDDVSPDDDTSYVEGTSGKDTYDMENLSGADTIDAVQVTLDVRETDAGGRQVRSVVRSGGTDYNGASVGVGAGFAHLRQIWPLDPNGDIAWTQAALNAAEIGAEIIP